MPMRGCLEVEPVACTTVNKIQNPAWKFGARYSATVGVAADVSLWNWWLRFFHRAAPPRKLGKAALAFNPNFNQPAVLSVVLDFRGLNRNADLLIRRVVKERQVGAAFRWPGSLRWTA